MLFKPNILILVQRGGLLAAGRRPPSSKLSFPDELVHNLEVLQYDKLVEHCQHFFKDKGIRSKRVQIVLDYSVVFEKVIELDKTGKPDVIMEGFIGAMPFEPGKRACVAVQSATDLHLYATNAELYQAVADALKAAGAGTLLAITPIAAYNLADDQRTVKAATELILKNNDVAKQANFRDALPS